MTIILKVIQILLNVFVVLGTPILFVQNDSPSILDENVTFNLELKNFNATSELLYIFNDSVSVKNVSFTSNSSSFVASFAFPASLYNNGSYHMEVFVKYNDENEDIIAKNYSSFELSDGLIGKIIVNRPEGFYDVDKVAVGEKFTIAVELHDPKHLLENATIDYMWSIDYDRQPFTYNNFSYMCSELGTTIVVSTVMAMLPNNIWKSGMFFKKIIAKDPVKGVNVSGNPFIHHGEMLNLNVSCSGSSPFIYCVQYFTANESTKNFSCSQSIVTNRCSFPIKHYFSKSGSYNYVIDIQNDVKHVSRILEVMVYNVNKQPQLSTVIIPIACSLATLIIISLGIAHCIQQRNQIAIEVANFDFQEEDPESFSSRTFFEQLFDSLNCGCGGSQANDNDIFSDEEHSSLIGRHRSRTPSF